MSRTLDSIALSLLLSASLLLLASGCSPSSHLVFHQKTVIGVDVAPTVETGNVHLVAGYKRKTTAYVPTAEVPKEGGGTTREAMSVLALTRVLVSFWDLPQIAECLATGDAAINLAGEDSGSEFNKCKQKVESLSNSGKSNTTQESAADDSADREGQ